MKSKEDDNYPSHFQSADLSSISAIHLRSLPHFSRKYEQLHAARGLRLYKIEEGIDSVVCLWKKDTQEDSVVKFYLHSAMTSQLLSRYAECVNLAVKSIRIPILLLEQRSISFSITPVWGTHAVNMQEDSQTVLSHSPYVKGIELEKASASTKYLADLLADADLTSIDSERLLQFAEYWKNNPDFKNAILGRIEELNTLLQKLFPTANPECDLINLKVTPTDDGWIISATDISPNIFKFSTAVTEQK